MKALIINETSTTPQVTLDINEGTFEFTGKSYPANADEFYEPILNWFDQYAQAPNPVTSLKIDLSFFNTTTAKIMAQVLFILADIPIDVSEVSVKWVYFRKDIDSKRIGEDMQMITHIPIKLVARE